MLFVAGALIAAICACHSELRQCPAALSAESTRKRDQGILEKTRFCGNAFLS